MIRTPPRPSARTAVLLSIAGLAVSPAAPAGGEPALEALLAVALPSAPLAVDSGRALAWLEQAAGERSVWCARAPAWAPVRLHAFGGDDGLELGELAASSDGKWLAFVRGGDEGAHPETNAASDPAGAEATVWLVPTDGQGAARPLGPGFEPTFSPRGDRLVFVRDGQLFSAPLGKKGEASQLTHLRGRLGAPRFSPDGSKLAFTSDRDTHRFVGLLDLGSRRVTWLDPGVDTDLLPTWSPDGSEVAFVRLPADASPPSFVPRRSAPTPWSLRVADASTGAGRELLRAAPGDGSVFHFFETNATHLFWTADGRIVFPWERSGWHHLWAIPAAGGAAYDLTPGSFEVEHAALAPDGETLVFTANDLDLDRRTLWKIAAAGGQRIRLDAGGEKFEFFPAPLAGAEIAFLETAARQPVTLALRDAAGSVRALRGGALAPGFPAAELVQPANVVFPSTDGLALHGQLFLPPGASAEAQVPAVVFVHGGPVRQMFAAPHFWGYYQGAYLVNQLLAARGIAVLSVNFRSGIGYGLAFREADGVGEAGAAEFQDVLAAALYLRGRPEIDGARLGIWGGSYGGYLTALALARASGTFRAGVDFHGVHDWSLEWPHPPFTRDYVATGKRLDRAFAASPMADLDTWRSPVLLVHGDDDHNVPFVETVRLVEELRERGVEPELLVFPDDVHGFLLHRNWLAAYRATLAFFERHLAREP
jgi:dipeptidyl aminopeptidase/acylaminoacyl peptidase